MATSFRLSVVLVLASIACSPAAAFLTKLDLDPIDGENRAVCMDGTDAHVYFRPSPSGTSKRWILNLPGGGACRDELSCKERAQTSQGRDRAPDKNGLDIVQQVPAFWDFNQASVPYCDGLMHSSTKWQPDAGSWGIAFAGRHILEAAVRKLLDLGMDDAELLIITGNSAGGTGTLNQANYIKSLLPSTNIALIPRGGFLHAAAIADLRSNVPDYALEGLQEQDPTLAERTQFVGNVDCIADAETSDEDCNGNHAVAMPYILEKMPVFLVWNRWDFHMAWAKPAVQLDDEDHELKMTLLRKWGTDHDEMFASYQALPNGADFGVFAPSCLEHAKVPVGVKMDGKGKADVITAWYEHILHKWNLDGGADRPTTEYQMLKETDGSWAEDVKCNPTCACGMGSCNLVVEHGAAVCDLSLIECADNAGSLADCVWDEREKIKGDMEFGLYHFDACTSSRNCILPGGLECVQSNLGGAADGIKKQDLQNAIQWCMDNEGTGTRRFLRGRAQRVTKTKAQGSAAEHSQEQNRT